MSPHASPPSSRTLVASLAAVAVAAPAVAADHPDADLIQVAAHVLALRGQVDVGGLDENVSAAFLEEVEALLTAACALPALTTEGLTAKARMLRVEYPETGARDPAECLVQSLLSDLIRQGGRA